MHTWPIYNHEIAYKPTPTRHTAVDIQFLYAFLYLFDTFFSDALHSLQNAHMHVHGSPAGKVILKNIT